MTLSIQTKLTSVTNEIDLRGREILRLIGYYLPTYTNGLYYGHRPIGADDIKFPAVMVEPISATEEMVSTGKYELKAVYNVYFYILDDNRDTLITMQTDSMACLTKLFSNNALNDLTTPATSGGFTNKYKSNSGFWINSEMSTISLSATFAFSKAGKPKYCRAGLFTLTVQDKIIK